MKHAMKILVALAMLSGGAAWAKNPNKCGGGHQGQGNNNTDCGQRGAPEPITMIGLAAGAGAVGLAAWRKRKKA